MSIPEDIEVGNIYKIAANEENNITPRDGQEVWYKHFVVMGKTNDGSVFGCVVFDSEINRNFIEPGDEDLYLPISKGRYPFIDHDSYLECLALKPASREKLLAGKAEGKLEPEDLNAALKLVKMSRRHSFMLLRMYGII